jgi:hypothetical protein
LIGYLNVLLQYLSEVLSLKLLQDAT